MDNVNKSVMKTFVWSMVFTIMLPAGVPMIILGAINKIWGLMGCGIAFVVLGFYGTPMLWVQYGEKKNYKRIVSAVVNERISSVKQIATHLNISEKLVVDRLDTCIRKEFLIGYVREGDLIRTNSKAFGKSVSCKCPACGATFEHLITQQAKCPYCRTIVD